MTVSTISGVRGTGVGQGEDQGAGLEGGAEGRRWGSSALPIAVLRPAPPLLHARLSSQ